MKHSTFCQVVELSFHGDRTGDRAFQVAAPKLWNSMPSSIRLASSLTSFKSLALKRFSSKSVFRTYLTLNSYIFQLVFSLSFLCFYLLFDVRA